MSLMKKAIGGSIHRIREFELEKVNLIDEFDILQIVGEGWFGKILLTEHRSTQTEMVLKALPKAYIGITDFFREFHYGLHLAAHRNIITTYDVAFETAGFYVFSQEYAPLGDLTSNVTETGLGELHAKRVARQLAAAVHHIHSRELVHRDIKLDNILVFRSDFSRIKLCDFGETRRVNSVVRRHNEWLPYSPPEVLQINTDETYKALTSHDVWQFGIVLFVCLTGCLPWQKAALDDPRYMRYQNWHNATLNIAKKPKLFQLISSRAQRLFKRLLDPKPEKRPVSVLEVNKYLEDRWLAKLGAEKALNGGADEMDELCPSMYSFHSSVEEKNQLLHTLTTYGIETTVDRSRKKDRIREWIQSSAIAEENEEDESDELNENAKNNAEEMEDQEPISMRGRHFPEMRPRGETSEARRRKKRTTETMARRRQSTKHIERKIPFAPQVAEERETVARFASFPNGDPTLAVLKNGSGNANGFPKSAPGNVASAGRTLIKMDSVPDDTSSSTNTNDRAFEDSPTDNGSTSRDNSVPTTISDSSQTTITDSERVPPPPLNGSANGSVPLKSPQVPCRKHRAQTSSPALNGNREHSTKRSQSVNAPIVVRSEKSPLPVAKVERSPPFDSFVVVPYKQSSPHSQSMPPEIQTNDVSKNSNEMPLVPLSRNEIHRNSGKERSNDVSQVLPVNSAMMSATSHLAIRSFNTLQSISNSSPPPQSSGSSSAPKSVPSLSTSKQQKVEEKDTSLVYGKDAFEHYGIAQGAIMRSEAPAKRTSINGSASRSVSN